MSPIRYRLNHFVRAHPKTFTSSSFAVLLDNKLFILSLFPLNPTTSPFFGNIIAFCISTCLYTSSSGFPKNLFLVEPFLNLVANQFAFASLDFLQSLYLVVVLRTVCGQFFLPGEKRFAIIL